MSHTSARTWQYLGLIIVALAMGGGYWYWQAQASTAKRASNTGLVGYWSFDEGTGTKAGDASVNNNTGTLTNGPTWTTGKLGNAVNLDGTDDYISVPQNGKFNLSGTGFTIALWVLDDTNLSSGFNRIVSWYDGSKNIQLGIASRGFYITNNTVDSQNPKKTSSSAPYGWNYVVATFDGATTYHMYLNGVLAEGGDTGLPGVYLGDSTTLYIGQRGGGQNYATAKIDELRIYSRALGATEITNLYNLGAAKLNKSPTGSLTSGLVGYWTFDGADTVWTSSTAGTVTDRSGNSNTMTLTAVSRDTSSKAGIIGQGYYDDGASGGGPIYASNSASIDLNTTVSLAFWIKDMGTTAGATWAGIVHKMNSGFTGYYVQRQNATQDIIIRVDTSGGIGQVSGILPNVLDGNWHHIVWILDNGVRRGYKDGILVVDNVYNHGTGFSAPSVDFKIGIENPGFRGIRDDVRLYNRALSATEIQSLYALGASDKVNSAASTPQGTGRLDSGLAGYWPLDDGSGTNANDASTNNNDGTLTNGPTWGTGQIGGDVDIDGTDDYINIGDNDTLDFPDGVDLSISGWFYRDSSSSSDMVIQKRSGGGIGYQMSIDWANSNKMTFVIQDTGFDTYSVQSGQTFTTTGWNHFVLIFDNDSVSGTKIIINGVEDASTKSGTLANINDLRNGAPLTIGATNTGTSSFDGKLDDIRLYNRALSDDEVSQLYRLTTPTGVDTGLKGYWSFNGADLSGTTAFDRSGSGNTGTLTNGPTVTPGKLGQALRFDGSDDYVDTGTGVQVLSGSAWSIATWIKTTSSATLKMIVAKTAPNTTYKASTLHLDSAHHVVLEIDSSASDYAYRAGSSTVDDNNWHFIVASYNGSQSYTGIHLYVDGIEETYSSGTNGGTLVDNSTANPLLIGKRLWSPSYPFSGSIDEVRIYNRVLSASEIAALYNSGR